MTPSSYDIPLHDIKPLMEVPDSSLTFLLLGLVVMTLLVAGGGYLFYKHLRERKQVNLRKEHYRALKDVDFTSPKKAAYQITEHGRFFAEDSQRLKETYENLVERLESYKYRLEVAPIDDESRSYYKIYLEMIDV